MRLVHGTARPVGRRPGRHRRHRPGVWTRAAVVASTALAALTVTVAVPGTARAAGVYRDDDGTRETAVLVDRYVEDTVVKRIYLPPTHKNGATGATLWVYAQATDCDEFGWGQDLRVNNWTLLADYQPCAVWPDSSFAWRAFPVPFGALRDGDVNTFFVRTNSSTRTGDNAYYGVDSTNDFGRSDIYQTDPSFTGDIPGELMMYLELTGSVPYVAVSPPNVVYGVHELATSVPRTVTVTSGGREPLAVSSVTLAGVHAADFVISADGCTGAVLAPEATCPVEVTFTPSVKGSRFAAVTVSTNAGDRVVQLHGEGKSDPPVTVITTPDGAVLTQLDSVTGTVTDDTGVARVVVTFTPVTSLLTKLTEPALLSCNSDRTACGWSMRLLLFLEPGPYTVTARSVDTQGTAEVSPTQIQVLVV